MRIPTEHFSRVPVFALSPGLSSPEGSDDGSSSPTFGRALMNRLLSSNHSTPQAPAPQTTSQAPQRFNSVGSAPTSPTLTRRTSSSITPTQLHSELPPPPKLELLDSVSTPDSNKGPEEQPQSLPVNMEKPTPAQRGSVVFS